MLLQNFYKLRLSSIRTAFRRRDTPAPDAELTRKVLFADNKYMEREAFPGEFAPDPPRGRIYDKKPFRIFLQADRVYNWCVCGMSRGQPICDGSHKRLDGTSFVKVRPLLRPLSFRVPTSDFYYLCNCKRTSNPPFCDGTHKQKDIQDAIKS